MRSKVKDRIKLFVSMTFILSLLFVTGRLGMLEQNTITCKQAYVGCLIALVFMAVSVATYWMVDKDNDVY